MSGQKLAKRETRATGRSVVSPACDIRQKVEARAGTPRQVAIRKFGRAVAKALQAVERLQELDKDGVPPDMEQPTPADLASAIRHLLAADDAIGWAEEVTWREWCETLKKFDPRFRSDPRFNAA